MTTCPDCLYKLIEKNDNTTLLCENCGEYFDKRMFNSNHLKGGIKKKNGK